MPSTPHRAAQRRRAGVVFPALLLGVIGLTGGGCVGTASPEASLQPAELTGKPRAWFVEHWGAPRARSKRFFGGETWVYFRIDGNRRSMPLFERAPHECQIHLTFDHQGALEEIALSGC